MGLTWKFKIIFILVKKGEDPSEMIQALLCFKILSCIVLEGYNKHESSEQVSKEKCPWAPHLEHVSQHNP